HHHHHHHPSLPSPESRARRQDSVVARSGSLKRRASSPPREIRHPSYGTAGHYHSSAIHPPTAAGFMDGVPHPHPQRTASNASYGGYFAAPPGANSRFHGSISSTSSYPSTHRNPSLASSAGYSIAASSMTSVDGPISPMSDMEYSPYEVMVGSPKSARASFSSMARSRRQSRPSMGRRESAKSLLKGF
ncbi:hypothetical protein KEM52_004542, partial [Ascosphaera acerosa]